MTVNRNRIEIAAVRADPTKRLRDALGPATRRHVDFMEIVKAHYVVTERDERLRSEIEILIENAVMRRDPSRPHGADNRREGLALAVIADSGAGKTAAMLNYLKNNPFFPGYGIPYSGCPLITVNVKAPTTLGQVGMSTLRATGYPIERELRENQAWAQVHTQLKGQGNLFLNFVEVQRIIQQKNVVERGKIIETFAGLLTDTEAPQHIIFSGLPPTADLFQERFLDGIKKDPKEMEKLQERHQTLRRRTRFVEFHEIDLKADKQALDKGIQEFEKLAGVSLKLLREGDMRARLRHAAAIQFGLFFELTVMAIDVCTREGRKTVTKDDYQDAYAARTREPEELNPFFADHWRSIDTSIIKGKPISIEDDQVALEKPERRRTDDEDYTPAHRPLTV
jgi:hypothetical protein